MAEAAERLRIALADACRRAYERHLVAGCSGNASVRTAEGLLVTATGACLGDVEADRLVLIDAAGRWRGDVEPTSELPLHLALYKVLPRTGAILHTHSPAATALAVAGQDLEPVSTEASACLGDVPCVAYAPPGSEQLARAAAAQAPGRKALLLGRHGVVVWAETPLAAFFQAEMVEEAARLAVFQRR